MARITICATVLALCVSIVSGAVSVVKDDSLQQSIRNAKPGDVIRIAPGKYHGGIHVEAVSGTKDSPIVIEAADEKNPPVFEGGANAIQLSRCSCIVLRNLKFRGQTGNGLNIDDGGKLDTPAVGVVLERLHVSDVGPRGNHDGIKLSGLKGFRVVDCVIEGWAGSAIDMVGCHEGVIEGCTFRGKEGFEQSTGPQMKGGSSAIVIRHCDFLNAGGRAINVGGSTGAAYFRPRDATWEAKEITVEDCRFVGSDAPVAFVGVDGATFRRNTIYQPKKWVMRILQENQDARFAPCRDVTFERNLIVFRRADVRVHVNLGVSGEPAAETFKFVENWWYCADEPGRSKPQLPAAERGGVYGRDPKVTLDETGLPVTGGLDYGAGAP
jgi:hypothetical protein